MRIKYLYSLLFWLLVVFTNSYSQNVWDVTSYPDEAGFQIRTKNTLQKLAEKGFGIISLSVSKCPDTGLPVYTYAIEGEEISSPFTGRKYKQPATGYFGVQQRNEKGEITAFGGDPLKYDLPTAMASMLVGEKVNEAKAFLSIPGNLAQQYHFACKNWARFYPMLADSMGTAWKQKFQQAVANYSESTRISDDGKTCLKLSYPHCLVGQPRYLLGGNAIDGGTENHKIMWRTSALLYAQLFPDTAHISGHTTKQTELMTKEMLRDYLKRLLVSGNGEYDSEIYYPYTIESFMNLYDFSPDKETKLLAKFALDYLFTTYGLKVIDGMIAGAQKRGYLSGGKSSYMETMLWCFTGSGSRDWDKAEKRMEVATTTYRPNKVITNIIRKQLMLPFEAKMSRPFYQMDKPFAFAESFYCSQNYAMGNIQMSIVDNPNQQMIWSLVAKGTNRPLCFSGSQPQRCSTSGHSAYSQTFHSKGTLIVMTAPTALNTNIDTTSAPTPSGFQRANYWLLPYNEHPKKFEEVARQKYAFQELANISFPDMNNADEISDFWADSKSSASTWFVFPKEIEIIEFNNRLYCETPSLLVSILPLNKNYCIVKPSVETIQKLKNNDAKKFFSEYNLVSFAGNVSGYIMETSEKSRFATIQAFDEYLQKTTKLDFSVENKSIHYSSSYSEKMEMCYQADKLRPKTKVNGKGVDYDNFTNEAVYQSPYLSIKKGIMKVSDGVSSYTVDFTKNLPVYKR